MAEYCRLCAELKDHSEIVASIVDDEQSIEQKLRACCCWSTANTEEYRLPHSVCAVCLDRLDKCWLFSQSVQLAQQRLLEIFEIENKVETKPLISELVQTIDDSTEHNLPPAIAFEFDKTSLRNCVVETANFQCSICPKSFKTNRSLREHCKQHYENSMVDELNANRQHGCEGLIEFGSNAKECKPTVDDCWNSSYHSDAVDNFIDFTDDAIADNNDDNDCDSDANEPKYFSNVAAARKALQKKRNDVNKEQKFKPSRWQYRCDECGLPFSSRTNLSRHQAKHTGLMPFECWLCHQTFQFRYLLIEHFKTHPISAKDLQQFTVEKEAERKQKERPHKCHKCDRSFTTKSYLERHRLARHTRKYKSEANENLTANRTTDAGEQHFECWQCHKMFMNKHALEKHLDVHLHAAKARNNLNETKKYAKFNQEKRAERINASQSHNNCDICGKKFSEKSKLLKHRVLHSDERPFECWLCHKVCKFARSLKFHMRAHLKTKKKSGTCICELCGKVFIHVNFLEDHQMTVHSDQRPHKCGICGLGYKTKRLLNSHHISHTEFQHKCTECGKSYRKKASLKMHMESHTGIINKPYVCDVCGKAFRKNCDSVEHRRIHTGEKPHKCEYCGLNFRTMSGCYTHLRKMHGVSVSARNREEQIRLTAMS